MVNVYWTRHRILCWRYRISDQEDETTSQWSGWEGRSYYSAGAGGARSDAGYSEDHVDWPATPRQPRSNRSGSVHS